MLFRSATCLFFIFSPCDDVMTRRDGASRPVEPGGIVGIVGCHVHMTKVMFGGGRGGGLSGDSGVE